METINITKTEYLEIKNIVDSWIDGNIIGISDDKKEYIPGDLRDINPFSFYRSKKMVIIDKHVDLRLALMRGECIEYREISSIDTDWFDKKNNRPDQKFVTSKYQYRIKKPDTSWVEDGAYAVCHAWSSKPFMIEIEPSGNIHFNHEISWNNKELFVKECKKWEPEKGDLCWFWNDRNVPMLKNFRENYEDIFVTYDMTKYDNCIPYFGKRFWER